MRGQKNGESIFLETFLSPFKLLKKLYKAELEAIARRNLRKFCKDKLWRGTPGREENHFSSGLGEYCFLTSADKSSFLQNDR